MQSKTTVVAKGFWVPIKKIIGMGSELYCVFCTDPDSGGNDYMFMIAANSEVEAQAAAEKHAIEFFNEDNNGLQWETEDFTVFVHFIGNAIV